LHKKENWGYARIFYITISFYQAFVSKQNVTLFKCFRASSGKTFTLGRARNVPIPHMINIFTIGTHAITRTACKLGIFLATQNQTFEILLFDYILVNATLKCDHKPKRLVKNIAKIMASFSLFTSLQMPLWNEIISLKDWSSNIAKAMASLFLVYILANVNSKWNHNLKKLGK